MAFYHILSLDGGGIRGLLTSKLLERLEKEHPGFLDEVDLIAGTSTGGILALGLAAGLKPAEISDIYQSKGKDIFADTIWDKLGDLDRAFQPEYSNKPLKKAVLDIIGDKKLKDLDKQVLITTFDLDGGVSSRTGVRSWKPKFFHNFPGEDSDGEESTVDIALRTSAAPTYFPIYQGYIDGGVIANNPSMCALAQALHPDTGDQKLSQVTVLSVGTGTNPKFIPREDGNWGLTQWAPHLVSIMIDGGSGVSDYQCKQILGPRYFRLNAIFQEEIGLGDIKQIPRLVELAESVDLKNAVKWVDKYYKKD